MTGKDLLGTKFAPEGLEIITRLAKQARAYYSMNPYPAFGFTDWKTEERGPIPKCLPFVRSITKRSARWLFGRGVDIHISGSAQLTEFIVKAWNDSKMPVKMIDVARRAALDGSYCLKYHFDENRQIKFTALSTVDNVRLYYDPMDGTKLLMARVQFPYYDAVEGVFKMYREEWTDELYVKYVPLPIEFRTDPNMAFATEIFLASTNTKPDNAASGAWTIEAVSENPMKIIPIVQIFNEDIGTPWGSGDQWSLYPIIDRINLTYHLMDKSNQFDSVPTPVYIDAVLEDDDLNTPLAPGEQQSLKTDDVEGSGLQAKVQLMEPGGKIRPYMEAYTIDLTKQVHKAAGSIDIDPEMVSNKGNLTQSVLAQVYGPLIESSDEKRRNFGDYGIVSLLDKLCFSMRASGLWSGKMSIPKSVAVEVRWPDYFPLSDAEKQQRLDRYSRQESMGLITKDRVVRELAKMDGIEDVEGFVKELEDYEPSIIIPSTAHTGKPGSPGSAPEAGKLAKPKQGEVTLP